MRAALSACCRASSRCALYCPIPKNATAVTVVRVLARRRRRTAIEGSTVSEAAVEWSADRRTFQVRQLNHYAAGAAYSFAPPKHGVPFRLDRASVVVSAGACDHCTVAAHLIYGQSRP